MDGTNLFDEAGFQCALQGKSGLLTGRQMDMTCKIVLAFLCSVGLTGRSSAADYICSGILIDQRVVGVSLGNCELNSLSDTDFKRVTDICGQPNGVGEETNKTYCYIRGTVVQKKNFPGIRVVTKLVGVAAEQPQQ